MKEFNINHKTILYTFIASLSFLGTCMISWKIISHHDEEEVVSNALTIVNDPKLNNKYGILKRSDISVSKTNKEVACVESRKENFANQQPGVVVKDGKVYENTPSKKDGLLGKFFFHPSEYDIYCKK